MGGRNPIHDLPLGTPHAANVTCEQSAVSARAAQFTKTRKWLKSNGRRRTKKQAHHRRIGREVYGDNFVAEAIANTQATTTVRTHPTTIEQMRRQQCNLEHVDVDIAELEMYARANIIIRLFKADASTADILEWSFERGELMKANPDPKSPAPAGNGEGGTGDGSEPEQQHAASLTLQ